MDWMEIGSSKDPSSRMWPAVMVAVAIAAGIAVAIALPNVIPSRDATQQGQQQATQNNDQAATQDGDANSSDVTKATIVGAENLTGLSADQASSLSTSLASWLATQGVPSDATVTLAKEPAAKGGATVLEVTVEGLEEPVACSWRDHAWSFAPASAIDGRDDATVRTTDGNRTDADASGEVGVYDAKRLTRHLGEACAKSLSGEWASFAAENGYSGPNDAVVDLTSVKAGGSKVSFTVVAPKAKDGFSEDVVDVTFDVNDGSYEMKAR